MRFYWTIFIAFIVSIMTVQCNNPSPKQETRRVLLLMRHAKTEGHGEKPDFERVLKSRGHNDALLMARQLKQRGITPDYIVSSSSKRTVETAEDMKAILGFSMQDVVLKDTLYHASARTVIRMVQRLDDVHETALMIGHNPSMIEVANHFQRDSIFMQVPTSGIVAIVFYSDSWASVHHHSGELLFFDYPKLHKKKGGDPPSLDEFIEMLVPTEDAISVDEE